MATAQLSSFVVNGNLSITDITLQNSYGTAGGAITGFASVYIRLKNCTPTGHKALYGAAILIGSNGTLQLDETNFSFNTVEGVGSSIHATRATVIISSSAFVNEANSAVFATTASTLIINNSTFSNSSGLSGAAIACLRSTTVYISGCLFDFNQASRSSGAIAILSQSRLVASDTVFRSNTADLGGGAAGTFFNWSAEFTSVSDVIMVLYPYTIVLHEVCCNAYSIALLY
jgi:hypothetical protein